MTQPDYHGARGSNAGDDFHELWALRQALTLLDPDTDLAAVTVEGLRAEDEKGVPKDTWDGVDCTFYYGGNYVVSAKKIVIDQLKYSAADPDKKWTIARLTHNTKKQANNSVLNKLAKAFAALSTLRPDLVSTDNLRVRLVSNQQIHRDVIETLIANVAGGSTSRETNSSKLLVAADLSASQFDTFRESLDVSECGQPSRFSIEESVLTTIASWVEVDARLAVEHLLRFIRLRMMPEAKGEVITRASILAQFGFSDMGALFPCPSAIKKVDRLVSRDESKKIADQMLAGNQRICFHGAGGCGKTTLLQDIATQLPEGSVVVTYDCYGGGRYLDSDAYRHRRQDAFLQLSNDLAQQLRSPFLLTTSGTVDYPRAFKKRLERAAELVGSQSPSSLLVLVADAADNSITAASTHSPPEPSFIPDFLHLGDLPKNVRVIVTCRTSSLSALNLPPTFGVPFEVKGFSLAETTVYVRSLWPAAPEPWIEDFHYLADGSPRVETYALDYAEADRQLALEYLRPHGKDLDKIFEEQMLQARSKVGVNLNIQTFCAGLVNLPRPVPVEALSEITELSPANIIDLCRDLAPGIRLKNDLISFADEDFEHYLRTEGKPQINLVSGRIANYFVSSGTVSGYSATHVASALLNAGRGLDVLELINAEREPIAISDPVLRRQVQLERLKIATKVCRDTGSIADAVFTVLVGAEALKTDAAIRKIFIENADLAASFARDTVSRMILRDADEIENHGPLLFHFMAADARRGDSVSVREGYRQGRAWLQRRSDYFKEEKRRDRHPHGWSIEISDIVAETEGLLRSAPPAVAIDNLMRWQPRSIAFQVATLLSFKLLSSGESDLVQRCLEDENVRAPWDLFLLTPLAVAGREIDVVRLESSLEQLVRRGLINLALLQPTYREEDPVGDYLETIITACEVVAARGGNTNRVIPALEILSFEDGRRGDRLHTSDITRIDITLRAHALLQRLHGRDSTIATYLVPAPPPDESLPEKQLQQAKKRLEENNEELQRFIGPFVALYNLRARVLTATSVPTAADDLRSAVSQSKQEDYRLRNEFRLSGMRSQAALSITRLTILMSFDPTIVYDEALSALGPGVSPFSNSETQVFKNLAVVESLHGQLLKAIAVRAETVKAAKVSADEKISALVRFARVLMIISEADAEELFTQAVAVADEVNVEAIWEIDTLAPLTDRAIDGLTVEQRKATASTVATIVSDAAIRLEGQDGFPWSKVGRALANLHLGVSLACMGRWEDSGIIDRESLLPAILKTSLDRGSLSPAQVTSVFSLVDAAQTDLLECVIDKVIHLASSDDVSSLVEQIAKEELLRFGEGKREEITKKLSSVPTREPGTWLPLLVKTTNFLHSQPSKDESSSNGNDATLNDRDRKKEELLETIEWNAYRFIDPSEINGVVSRVLSNAKASETFISVSEILFRIGGSVALSDRISHLEALMDSRSGNIDFYELGRVIPTWIEEWGDYPSISSWKRERLLNVIRKLLPAFVGYLVYDQSPLPTLIKESEASKEDVCSALLDAIAGHIDGLDARTVYALVGLTARYCDHRDAAIVLQKYAERLFQRIPVVQREDWDLADIPDIPPQALARFLYALMGDTDVRNRWRSGHALRCLARFDETDTLDEFRSLYEQNSDSTFRRPDAPFYWLAARLWLVISLDRISTETPGAIPSYGRWLFNVATNVEFPHLLVRLFAKSAATKLVRTGHLLLDSPDTRALNAATASLLPRKKPSSSTARAFDRYQYELNEKRRFHFDTMDTLPYWYSSATSAFADVDQETFLDVAETWIVDHWKITSNPWQWVDEPRQDRFSERDGQSMDHSHGSHPTLERLHTYLEWHAMWCAIGELMQTHALAKLQRDDYDRFESKLERNQLTVPPLWLADVRGAKPLEGQLWNGPHDVVEWMKNVTDTEFLSEVLPDSSNGSVVVDGNHDTRSRAFRASVKIRTAVVSPETALSLARSLQTARDYRYYDIPTAGEDSEINYPPYQLRGWLESGYRDLGIDERDALRYDIDYIHSRPSRETISALKLKEYGDVPTAWWVGDESTPSVVYEAWGESKWDERHDRLRYEQTVLSSGSRLLITKVLLTEFLAKHRCDLLAEVRITKRNKGSYDYSQYEEKPTEETFVKIILFRKDGTIEDANGRVGTWAASGR